MLTLALTGGIGSGKSSVAAVWRECGAHIIDADQIAREVVEPGTPALEKIVKRWGRGMLTDDGGLNRAALAGVVFQDPGERAVLESITHPAVADEVQARLMYLNATDPTAVVIYDVPLLVGQPGQFAMTANVTVNASADTRLERLVRTRNMPPDDARARIASQATDAERTAISDVVITNEGAQSELRHNAFAVWEEWIVPFNERLIAGVAGSLEPKEALPGSAGTGVVYRTERDIQKRRLEAHGFAVGGDAGTFLLTTSQADPGTRLARAGWVKAGKVLAGRMRADWGESAERWTHANPAVQMSASLA